MLVISTSTAVEGKTYITFAGHSAVRYSHSEIAPVFQPYIDYIEYDTACVPGAGARLYFTPKGKTVIKFDLNLAESIARNVRCAPEWTGDRSLKSVKYEIWQHAAWPYRMQVDIEYYYRDLKSWEVPYNSY